MRVVGGTEEVPRRNFGEPVGASQGYDSEDDRPACCLRPAG